jgi:hypothetical protein
MLLEIVMENVNKMGKQEIQHLEQIVGKEAVARMQTDARLIAVQIAAEYKIDLESERFRAMSSRVYSSILMEELKKGEYK